jgi:hypothetical protein
VLLAFESDGTLAVKRWVHRRTLPRTIFVISYLLQFVNDTK